MVDSSSWGADPQGPRAGMAYPVPGKVMLEIGVAPIVAQNLTKQGRERGLSRNAWAEQLFLASYSAKCKPTGDADLDAAVAALDAPKQTVLVRMPESGEIDAMRLKLSQVTGKLGGMQEQLNIANRKVDQFEELNALAGKIDHAELETARAKISQLQRDFDVMHEQRAQLGNDVMAERGKLMLAQKAHKAELAKLADDLALTRNAATLALAGESAARKAKDTQRMATLSAIAERDAARKQLDDAKKAYSQALAAIGNMKAPPTSPRPALTPQQAADRLSGAVVRHVKERFAAGMAIDELARLAKIPVEAMAVLLKLPQGDGGRMTA